MRVSTARRRFFVILFVMGIAAIVFTDARRALREEPLRPTPDELRAALPDATHLKEQAGPFHHWLAFSGGVHPIGAVFLTTELPPDVRGYVGPVPVLVGMDRSGVIVRLILLRNRETPYYMRLVVRSELLERLAGRSVADPRSHAFGEMDAVSGATVTSRAITMDVATAASTVAERIFDIDVPGPVGAHGRAPLPLIALAISLGLGLAARLRRRVRWLKWSSLLVGIAVVGLYLSIPLSMSHITALLAGDFPSWSNNPRLVLLVCFAAVTTLIWGPVFCGHVCPFGALQELAYRATPGWRLRVHGSLLRRLQDLRWLVLFVLIVLVFPLGFSEAAGFEPYPYLFDELHRQWVGGASSHSVVLRACIWGYAVVVLVMSAGVKRFWCRIFCPTGACLLLLSRHRRGERLRSGIEV